ncbi:hypothetical protein [Streptomyces sp. NBC_01285]|uniref:hypothetical protein n=1 Tax=Streptomyces sp. NBC_01285 TaxID=2903813 RepID=UPI00225353B3|nr:hypothetical protein [Streptomyces sp. NBC_01285]MCX4774889.1 hypothetical protein [Streptomyces sp. NBC_01285]
MARPLFCDLLAHTPLNLERNVSTDTVRTFKKGAITEVERTADTLSAITPLKADQARAVVTTTTSMAGVLWQMAAPGTQLRAFYESEPELSRSVVDVERPPDRHPDRAAHRLRHRLEPAHRELRNPRATPWPSDRRRCHGFNYPSVVDRAAPSRW